MVTKTRFTSAGKGTGPSPAANGKLGHRSVDRTWTAMQRALGALGKRLPEMRQDLSCYTAVQVDRARLAATNLVNSLASRVLQLLAVAAVCSVAVYLVIIGIAGGVATALAGHVWLANLMTGAGTLVVLAIALAIRAGSRRYRRLRRLRQRYRGLDRSLYSPATEVANDAQ